MSVQQEQKSFSLTHMIVTSVWVWWVLASGVAWAIVGLMGRDVAVAVARMVHEPLVPAVSRAIVGAVVGVTQWLVLRRHVPQAGWWVLACSVGWVVGGMVGEAVFSIVSMAVGRILGAAVIGIVGWTVSDTAGAAAGWALNGAAVGATQWLVFRRHVSQAGWWVLASSIGWAVGGMVGEAVGDAGELSWVYESSVIGTVGAAITGFALVILLQRSDSRVELPIPGKVIAAFLTMTILAGAEAGVFAAANMRPGIMSFISGHLDFLFLLTLIAALSLGWSTGGATGLVVAEKAPISRAQNHLITIVSYGTCVLVVGGLWGVLPGIAESPLSPTSLFLEIILDIFDVQPISLLLDLENLTKASGVFGAVGGLVVGILYWTAFAINLRREATQAAPQASQARLIGRQRVLTNPTAGSITQFWAACPERNISVVLAWLEYLFFGGANPIRMQFLLLRGAVVAKKRSVLVGVSPFVKFVRLFGLPKFPGIVLSGASPAWHFSKFGITAIFDDKGICSVLSARCAKPSEDSNCFSGEVFIPPHYFISSHSRLGLDVRALVGVLETAEMPGKSVTESPFDVIWSYHLEREDWGDSFLLEVRFSTETYEIISLTCITKNKSDA